MKQSEKTKHTQERILAAAMAEFGAKGYENASLNAICSENQISKGLIYHNFKNKDALYLECVKICFDALTDYLQRENHPSENARDSMQRFLTVRQTFFQENPYYGNLFFNTVLQPPDHLRMEIQALRRGFDDYCTACYLELLKQIPLRPGIRPDMALEYFMIFQEMFNGYFQRKSRDSDEFSALIMDHEEKLSGLMDILLYGISKEKPDDQ